MFTSDVGRTLKSATALPELLFPKDRRLSKEAAPVGESCLGPGGPSFGLANNPHRLVAQTTGRLGDDLDEVEEVGSSSSRGGGLGAEEGGSCKAAYR